MSQNKSRRYTQTAHTPQNNGTTRGRQENRILDRDDLLLREPGGVLQGLLHVGRLQFGIAVQDFVDACAVCHLADDYRNGECACLGHTPGRP